MIVGDISLFTLSGDALDEVRKSAVAYDQSLRKLGLANQADTLLRNRAAGEVFEARRRFLNSLCLPMPTMESDTQ